MKALAHKVMHIQLQVSFIKFLFNVTKQSLPKMISSEFTDDYDVRLKKSEHKIFKVLKVLMKCSIAIYLRKQKESEVALRQQIL